MKPKPLIYVLGILAVITVLYFIVTGGLVQNEYFIRCNTGTSVDLGEAQGKKAEVEAKGWSNCEIRTCTEDVGGYGVWCPEMCSHGSNKCDGYTYLTCDTGEYGFDQWISQGKVVDKCGVQCTELQPQCSDGHICNYLTGLCEVSIPCTPNIEKKCDSGNVYWYDSCGVKGQIAEQCIENQECKDAKCEDTPVNLLYYVIGGSAGLILISGSVLLIRNRKKR